MAKRIESPSSINTFRHCQRKYYYQYVEKLPTLSNIHQVRGNIAHSALELFFDIDLTFIPPEDYSHHFQSAMQRLFLGSWKSHQPELQRLNLSQDQERFYFEETMLMLMNWTTQFCEELGQTMLRKKMPLPEAFFSLTPIREQEFSSAGYSVRGFIDAIHQVENEVHIIDYKTNSSFEFKDEIRLQLAIYSLLYYEKHGKIPAKVGIFFLRHKLKLMRVDEELLNLAKREIQLIHAHTSVKEQKEDYPKKVGPLCKWSTGKCNFYEICKPHEEEPIRLPPENSTV